MNYIISFLLVTTGLLTLFNVTLADIFIRPFDEKRRINKQIRFITGKKKNSIERTIDNAKEMLVSSHMEKQVSRYRIMAIIFAFAGILIGYILDNLLVAIVLGVGLSSIPLVIIYIRTGEYEKALNEKLENAMNTITNNYVQSAELISSVEKSINYIPSPLDSIFRQFLVDVNLDNDIQKAIQRMSYKIDNRYFRDWCNILKQCQYDSSLRVALLSIVSRLSEMRILKMQSASIIKKHINEYVLISVVVLGSIPVTAMMMHEWWIVLTTSVVGKITLAVVLAGALFCSVWVASMFTKKVGDE